MDPFKPRVPKTSPDATTVALQAVAYIVGDEALLDRFIALSGCDADSLRQRLNDPAFLAAVLDFLLQHEPDLLAFCEAADLSPETVAESRERLG